MDPGQPAPLGTTGISVLQRQLALWPVPFGQGEVLRLWRFRRRLMMAYPTDASFASRPLRVDGDALATPQDQVGRVEPASIITIMIACNQQRMWHVRPPSRKKHHDGDLGPLAV